MKREPAKCADCGKPLDFRKGVSMRGPLDTRLVCAHPCADLVGKTMPMFGEALS